MVHGPSLKPSTTVTDEGATSRKWVNHICNKPRMGVKIVVHILHTIFNHWFTIGFTISLTLQWYVIQHEPIWSKNLGFEVITWLRPTWKQDQSICTKSKKLSFTRELTYITVFDNLSNKIRYQINLTEIHIFKFTAWKPFHENVSEHPDIYYRHWTQNCSNCKFL